MAESLLSENQLDDTTKPPVRNKTIREGGLVPLGAKIYDAELAYAGALTRRGVRGNILRCWFPDSHRGQKREHGHYEFEHSNLKQSVAAPATVSGEPASNGHWETGKA